jgi:predicted metal-dependent phosphoesterase TrpH
MIDLHCHTTASDGSLTPALLASFALGSGLSHLAITDHDSIDGIESASAAAEGTGLSIIAGIELEVAWEPGEFHVLGLRLRDLGGPIAEAARDMATGRRMRNILILDRIRSAGVDADMADLERIAGSHGIIGRPHIAELLVEKKVVKTKQEAFDLYLGKGRLFYLPRTCLPLPQIIAAIHDSGGLAIVAHPMSLYASWSRLASLFIEWKELGIDGLEAWHPTAKVADCERLESMGRAAGFRISAGSDFHGPGRPDRHLGYTAGARPIADSYLADLDL